LDDGKVRGMKNIVRIESRMEEQIVALCVLVKKD
jgi:hypothetical protein